MHRPGNMHLKLAPLFAFVLAGLVACGDADNARQDAGQAAENGLENFTPNVPANGDDTATVPTESHAGAEENVPAAFAPEVAVPDPTTAMSHNPDDTAEDMFQRGFYEEALVQWREDAEAGNDYAAYRLGVEYFDGQVVARDLEQAARYQQLASDLGNPAAMFELASFYEEGIGVDQNIMEAAAWYQESARRGYPPAQHNIATMFEDGTSVQRDLVQAYLFYSLAIEQGFRVSFARDEETGEGVFIDPRDRLRAMMTDAQISEAETLVGEFTPVE